MLFVLVREGVFEAFDFLFEFCVLGLERFDCCRDGCVDEGFRLFGRETLWRFSAVFSLAFHGCGFSFAGVVRWGWRGFTSVSFLSGLWLFDWWLSAFSFAFFSFCFCVLFRFAAAFLFWFVAFWAYSVFF